MLATKTTPKPFEDNKKPSELQKQTIISAAAGYGPQTVLRIIAEAMIGEINYPDLIRVGKIISQMADTVDKELNG